MNLVEYFDPIYTILEKTYAITSEKMEQIKQMILMLLRYIGYKC